MMRFTDAYHFVKTQTGQATEKQQEEITQKAESPKYAVVLHNDPLNSMEFVVKVIRAVFGYGISRAVWLMLTAHFTGRSALWIGGHEEAEQKRDKMLAYGPDPLMVKKGAKPLQVSVERQF